MSCKNMLRPVPCWHITQIYRNYSGQFNMITGLLWSHAIHTVDKRTVLYPDFQVYLNTSWYEVELGPHETPCSLSYGIVYSDGIQISQPISNQKDSSTLFAILKDGSLLFIPRSELHHYQDKIQNAFSGALVTKDGKSSETIYDISVSREKTARTVIALDWDGNFIALVDAHANVKDVSLFLREKLDAKDIMIVDGGGSSRMIVRDLKQSKQIATRTRDRQGARPTPSILAFKGDEINFDLSLFSDTNLNLQSLSP